MKYKDAMSNYGVDKPDTRFDNLVIYAYMYKEASLNFNNV